MLLKFSTRLVIFMLLLSACGPVIVQPATGTPSPLPTSSVPGSTVTPSETLFPPTATITLQPVSGQTLWQVNVRSGPGVTFSQLGQINQGQTVQITGTDASKEWLAIIYPSGSAERGWITAQFVQVSGLEELPVLGMVTLPNGTPAPQAHVTEKINVRSGPGTHYDSLGVLPGEALVWLIGRNQPASWLMIDYPSAPGGKGWIIAGFVKAADIDALPVVDSSGVPLQDTPPAQGTQTISTATPNLEPAFQDGDSADKPSANVVFSPLGSQSFSFSSDLSAPQGDREDWIAFQPYASIPGSQASLSASLTCSGNGTILVEIWQAGQPVSNWGTLACGSSISIGTLIGGGNYLFHLSIKDGSGFRYVLYDLTIHNNP